MFFVFFMAREETGRKNMTRGDRRKASWNIFESFEKAQLVLMLLGPAGVGGDDSKQQQQDRF